MGRVVWSVREVVIGELDAPEILGGNRSASPVHVLVVESVADRAAG
jgi:hypothetical protein